MPSETSLNQLVKGAPTANIVSSPPRPLPPLAPAPPQQAASNNANTKYAPSDMSSLPSSPPQIYLNLLILETSLRSQYLHLLTRRRINTFFLLLLSVWNGFFVYALFFRPREDGLGLGGSVYWVVEVSEKLALMGGAVTTLLIWATGQYERGIKWPRRWLGTSNRGLRTFNLRIVILKRRWYRELLGHLAFLLPLSLLISDSEAGGFADWHLVEHENGTIIEEDLAKGGDHIMLLLLPKSFSPEFRENWEEYRTEYWDRENERRAALRRKLKLQRRTKARDNGGWKWYTGVWRLIPHRPHRRPQDLEKHPAGHHHTHSQQQHQRQHSRPGLGEKDASKTNRRRSFLRSDSQSHSRQSSRSSTPVNPELDGAAEYPFSERVRRGSSVSSTGSVRRKTRDRTNLSGLAMTEEKPRKKKDRDAAVKSEPDAGIVIKKEKDDVGMFGEPA